MHQYRTTYLLAALPLFLPWSQFKDQKLATLKDQQKIKVSFVKGSTCNNSGKKFEATLALTEASRAFGLSNRKKPLTANEAMLFVFEYPRAATFWMKETLIPMQIGFIDTNDKLTKAEFMPVEEDPDRPKKLYHSPSNTIAAMEVAPHSLDKLEKSIFCIQLD